jgi:glycosyltransferase involved in cell wall biosynthesis
MTAQIAVVIPTYNRAGYVQTAIDSALAQTRLPDEIVVVDDGSTDDTAVVLARYGARVRYFRKDNGGEASARNRGVREASSTWIAFLDSDDAWEPTALAQLEAAAGRYPEAGLIAMRARVLSADGVRGSRTHGKKSKGPRFSTRSLLWGDAGGVQMPLVRRDLILAAGGFDESLPSATDCDLWIRLSLETEMVGIPEPLLLCRVHPENLSADRTLNARCWIRLLDKLAREHPEFVRDNPWHYRRALGKERLRLGRELLASSAGQPERLRESRDALRASIAAFPFFGRAWLYLVWSFIAPGSYAAFRRFERRARG